MRLPLAAAAVTALTLFALPALPATAHAEPQLGLGLARTADSAMFQVDLDPLRHVGFQAATGQSLGGGNFSGSAGGRFYLFGGRVSPYLGVIYDVQSIRHVDPAGQVVRTTNTQYAGPTVGFRVKARHGLGAYLEMQYLASPGGSSNEPPHPAVGAGVQWWF